MGQVTKAPGKMLKVINVTQDVILFLSIMIVALLVFIQVILRYVLHMPLMGIEELLVFPTIWLYFLGSVNASKEETQITARVLEVFIKKDRSIYLLRMIASIASVVIVMWQTWWGYDYFKYALRTQKESATLYIPLVYAESAIFIGLLLMTIYTVIQVFKDYRKFSEASGRENISNIKQVSAQ